LSGSPTSFDPLRELTAAFPESCARSIAAIVPRLSWRAEVATSGVFEVSLGAETLRIPERIYCDPATLGELVRLAPDEADLVRWFFTRHHDGHVRERCLREVIDSPVPWGPAFVLRLIGEYVLEILDVICEHVPAVDEGGYRDFLRQNRRFYETTRSRVASYWDCYYREFPRSRYPGFVTLEALDALLRPLA
jgi:hypothetical protein